MGIHGRIAVLVDNLQLIVKEYGIFTESGSLRVVHIRKQAAFQGLSGDRMEP